MLKTNNDEIRALDNVVKGEVKEFFKNLLKWEYRQEGYDNTLYSNSKFNEIINNSAERNSEMILSVYKNFLKDHTIETMMNEINEYNVQFKKYPRCWETRCCKKMPTSYDGLPHNRAYISIGRFLSENKEIKNYTAALLAISKPELFNHITEKNRCYMNFLRNYFRLDEAELDEKIFELNERMVGITKDEDWYFDMLVEKIDEMKDIDERKGEKIEA